MFELTGSLSYTLPHMLAILTAKWIADAISSEGVYDLAQTLLSHPFLDPDTAIAIARRHKASVSVLVPPRKTMEDITVHVPASNTVGVDLLRGKLGKLKESGLMEAGLVLVQAHPPSHVPILQGYISQSELDFGLSKLLPTSSLPDIQIRLLGHEIEGSEGALEVDLSPFVDRTPLSVCQEAPLEYVIYVRTGCETNNDFLQVCGGDV